MRLSQFIAEGSSDSDVERSVRERRNSRISSAYPVRILRLHLSSGSISPTPHKTALLMR